MPVSLLNILPVKKPAQLPRSLFDDDNFKSRVKPFLMTLKIAGLHHFDFEIEKREKRGRHFAVAFRGVISCLLASNFLFSLGDFINVNSFDSVLLNSLITSIWFLQVTLICINNAFKSWRWERIYSAWDTYTKNNRGQWKLLERLSLAFTCLYVIWLLVSSVFITVSLMSSATPSGFMVNIPPRFAVYIIVIIIIAYFFLASTWFLLTSQYVLVCVCVYTLLKSLFHNIRRCVDESNRPKDIVEKFRMQHEQICRTIKYADDILSIFIMVAVFTTIPLIVLTLYFVLFVLDAAATFSYAATWWSICLSTLQLVIVFSFGGAVNYMAHRPSSILYRLDLNNMSQLAVSQLGIFLNRLTSQPIGLTAGGLFVLDKPTIITFVGSIATYAIVLIQFKPGNTNNACVCTGNYTAV